MNRLFLLLAFSVATLGLSAQQRAVYAEVNGASNRLSVNFDSRLSAKSKWGYNVGLGYSNNLIDNSNLSKQRFFSLPLRMYYLFGKKNHSFETSIGVVPGFYSARETYAYTSNGLNQTSKAGINDYTVFLNYLTCNLGYRYQNHNGFILRAGLALNAIQSNHRDTELWGFQPFLALGYSF